MVTSKAHMQQQRRNLRSKKLNKADKNAMKTGECYFIITPLSSTGKTFSDQTGRFLVTSSKGNKYIRIIYDYDSNIIMGEPMKYRTEAELL